MGTGLLIRLFAVGSFAAAPVALNTAPATPAIFTGDATATGPGIHGENTGGNVQGGVGRSESRVVIGDPAAAPAVPGAAPLAVPPAPVVPKNPAADAVSRAHRQVEAAKARAQAAVEAAKARAEEAVERAQQQAEDAQARSRQHSDDARARSEAHSSSSSASAYTAD